MASAEDRASLAGAAATIAIASLGGPVAAGAAALGEVVKRAQARYRQDAPARDLHRQVTAAIKGWAASEGVGPEVDHGLALAAGTMAVHGADTGMIATLNFDAAAVTDHVIAAARAADRWWGLEDHYAVAERVIAETYAVLIMRVRNSEPVLVATAQALRAVLAQQSAEVIANAQNVTEALAVLTRVLVESADVADVMAYLETRIKDWDQSVWHPGQQWPSVLERQLKVLQRGQGSSGRASSSVTSEPPVVTAQEALRGQPMLVVLGSPGSGKTWIARHYARHAAQTALSALECGVGLKDVELPLLTTWDLWTKAPGDLAPVRALIASSFASGLGHREAGDSDTVTRLQRAFAQPGRNVLLVVDSLDEAADRAGQGGRLRELTGLTGGFTAGLGGVGRWRVVVTSRPAAWASTAHDAVTRDGGPRVVQVQDLNDGTDVEGFVRAWFAHDPQRGEALIRQIGARQDLARVAVIPLMLTFFCLLTEETDEPDRPLPRRPHDLYRRLIRRLLRGSWVETAPGSDASPDIEACGARLQDWAWHAVYDRVTSTGLGDWGDTFVQPSRPAPGEARALDHVARRSVRTGKGR